MNKTYLNQYHHYLDHHRCRRCRLISVGIVIIIKIFIVIIIVVIIIIISSSNVVVIIMFFEISNYTCARTH
jgi:hypothetical protein